MIEPTTDLGRNIRRLRRAAGLTQPQLAERLGVQQSVVSEIETGRRSLSVARLDAWARALSCRPADLLAD